MLNVTHSCPHGDGDDRGGLHWLGTNRGKSDYRNPSATGAVRVFIGGIKDITYNELRQLAQGSVHPLLFTSASRKVLVEYRPTPAMIRYSSGMSHVSSKDPCYSLWCGMSRRRIPTVVDLRSVKLRLKAYSIRFEYHGMTDWNFEARIDGMDWITLHSAQNEDLSPIESSKTALFAALKKEGLNNERKSAILYDFADRAMRHTWEITRPIDMFFRFFRIIGSGSDYEHGESSNNCLHGAGLELYGHVHEE